MKVFVDLRKTKIAGVRFAFWNTVTDSFVRLNGCQGWDDMEEFMGDAGSGNLPSEVVNRLVRLAPDWTKEAST